MVERRTCSFCKRDIEPGTGKMYILRDGTTYYYCSNKCNKHHLKLKHEPREVKWTLQSIRERKGQEVVSEKGVGVLRTTAAKEKPSKSRSTGGE
jgi:large subunit ribosomal protein L24e